MRKAWFCYEMGAKGPCPCIYYDDPPNEKNRLNRTVLQKFVIPESMITSDGEVGYTFYGLQQMFPYTGKHYDLEAEVA